MEEMDANNGCVGLDLRRRLASRAFSETSRYDALIASYIR
jgi:AICAR transformylase/IMP cyclohydrolase PurH